MAPNPYDLLGVRSSSSEAEIRAAYRARAKVLHPDAGGDADEFALLTEAYDLLMDPVRRAEFERTGTWAPLSSSVDPDADLYAEVGMALATAIADVGVDPATTDVIDVLRVHYRNTIKRLRAEIDEGRARVARVKLHRHRLQAESPVFGRVLDEIVGSSAQAEANRVRMIQRAERVIALLDGMSWGVDEPPSGSAPGDIFGAFWAKLRSGAAD